MINWVYDFTLFLTEAVIIVIAILAIVGGMVSMTSKGSRHKNREHLDIHDLNKEYQQMALEMQSSFLPAKELKSIHKMHKKQLKLKRKSTSNKRLFVLDFKGDLRANRVANLRREVDAVLLAAQDGDEVLLRLESPGGVVHGYGLAASQLQRFREQEIHLTVAVDKVAASGGYLMACVADQIIAAPFAIVGSIGVVAQLPNFNRLLKSHNIDYEQFTAGEYKRTITLFGENTDKARNKMHEELQQTHDLFKDYITRCRPVVNIDQVATGEHWFASHAIEFNLVDKLQTSDSFLLEQRQKKDMIGVQYTIKPPLQERLGMLGQSLLERLQGSSDEALQSRLP